MKLTFIYQAVDDLPAALAFYRDELGLDESWREGESTVAFDLPGSPVQLMLDVPPDGGPGWKSGMFCEVPDVDTFVKEHPNITWVGDVFDLPDGRGATFTDPAGNTIHVFDQRPAAG
ncbi:VOC family protein [Phytoactinopolyspora halotolerans]|uniref:VOC family protein n=1 Tax=Phytoactinopolyspora halotolerans TaxID=1981512 RepID=A0A6L9S5R6_9ACTN|nr:VOC family protein [Phytoactinopolyspora halotolerans]NED99983.1 VOC family protein [Phytoactinopolyspora halotolerans]